MCNLPRMVSQIFYRDGNRFLYQLNNSFLAVSHFANDKPQQRNPSTILFSLILFLVSSFVSFCFRTSLSIPTPWTHGSGDRQAAPPWTHGWVAILFFFYYYSASLMAMVKLPSSAIFAGSAILRCSLAFILPKLSAMVKPSAILSSWLAVVQQRLSAILCSSLAFILSMLSAILSSSLAFILPVERYLEQLLDIYTAS